MQRKHHERRLGEADKAVALHHLMGRGFASSTGCVHHPGVGAGAAGEEGPGFCSALFQLRARQGLGDDRIEAAGWRRQINPQQVRFLLEVSALSAPEGMGVGAQVREKHCGKGCAM